MSAYFAMQQKDPDGKQQRFVFKLDDKAKIIHARKIISGEETLKVHVQGTVVASTVPYNLGWSFHLEPASIGFFEMQIEVCDANVAFVEKHLEEVGGAFLPKSFWCPWSSHVVEEVQP